MLSASIQWCISLKINEHLLSTAGRLSRSELCTVPAVRLGPHNRFFGYQTVCTLHVQLQSCVARCIDHLLVKDMESQRRESLTPG